MTYKTVRIFNGTLPPASPDGQYEDVKQLARTLIDASREGRQIPAAITRDGTLYRGDDGEKTVRVDPLELILGNLWFESIVDAGDEDNEEVVDIVSRFMQGSPLNTEAWVLSYIGPRGGDNRTSYMIIRGYIKRDDTNAETLAE